MKIHQTISDAMKRDWKAFALDLGGAGSYFYSFSLIDTHTHTHIILGGVFSILYKFISSDVRKVIEESYVFFVFPITSLSIQQ